MHYCGCSAANRIKQKAAFNSTQRTPVLQEILAYYLANKPVADDVSAALFARKTPGFAGAELANMVNEAALAAAKGGGEALTAALLDEARDKVMMGRERTITRSEVRQLDLSSVRGCAVQARCPAAAPERLVA